MKFCGIDLAVKRPSAVGILEGDIVCVKELISNDEIYEECKNSLVVSIDSPLTYSNGFRNVDREMIRRGYKVLPPSWMKSLVERAITLKNMFKTTVIETHPTSSMKNISLNWKSLANKKDIVDAVLCSLVSLYYYIGKAEEISSIDGKIYILPKEKISITKIGNNCFKISSQSLQVAF
ncbi:hypothetical protein SJAV_03760 [Sulfurisphaera javensis]|uniref:DUF429 domain-containing protein n=1 Tax=Sulfurisphaera javensis TaxID=2049879 RepID=A0AAT9GNG9_9CREN